MSNEKMNKIIGAAFENMSFADMAKIQGAGDVDGETLKQANSHSRTKEFSKGLFLRGQFFFVGKAG